MLPAREESPHRPYCIQATSGHHSRALSDQISHYPRLQVSHGLIPLASEPGFDENVMTWEKEGVLVILSENPSKIKILKCFSHYALGPFATGQGRASTPPVLRPGDLRALSYDAIRADLPLPAPTGAPRPRPSRFRGGI